MKDINGQVTTYVEKKIPFYRHWGKNELKAIVKFFSDLGQLIIHQNAKGEIDGVMAFEFINTPKDILKWKNDFNSEGLAIIFLASDTQDIRREIARNMMVLTGVRKWICFERGKYNDRMRVLPWSLAERMS